MNIEWQERRTANGPKYTAQKTLATPVSVWYQNDFPKCTTGRVRRVRVWMLDHSLKVMRVDIHPQWFVNMLRMYGVRETMRQQSRDTYCFDKVVEIILRAEHSTGPPSDVVTVRHQSSTFCRASLQDIQDVPNVVQREFWFAHAHAQTQQGRLIIWFIGI